FSRTVPDVRMLKLLLKLPRRNTDALIGAVADELLKEGIELIDSTYFLQEYVPRKGVLTRREPDHRERDDIEYGLEIARELARLDLGQTIVVRAKACVAVEAMEGTDVTIRRAGELIHGGIGEREKSDSGQGGRISALAGSLVRGRRPEVKRGRLTVVKI